MDTGIYTETLARLYLRQGFIEQALTIYRQLAQTQPDHSHWQETIAALEQQVLLNAMQPPALSHTTTASVPSGTPARMPCCPTHRLIAQLERWLTSVQQLQA